MSEIEALLPMLVPWLESTGFSIPILHVYKRITSRPPLSHPFAPLQSILLLAQLKFQVVQNPEWTPTEALTGV